MLSIKRCIILILTACLSMSAYPQGATGEPVRRSHSIYFRTGQSGLDLEYKENKRRMEALISDLGEILKASSVKQYRIEFTGSSSPEGSIGINRRLSRQRLNTVEQYVRTRLSLPDSIVSRNDKYIAWRELAGFVRTDNDLPEQAKTLEILDRESTNTNTDHTGGEEARVKELKSIAGGRVWRQLNERYFPLMRGACVIIEIREQAEETVPEPLPAVVPEKIEATKEPEITEITEAPQTTIIETPKITEEATPTPLVEPATERKLHIKSNLLGWSLAIANIAAETDITRHWSFTLPVYYSAWNYFTGSVKFRTLSFQPEVRYWTREDNNGWFTGAHIGVAWYNIATDASRYRRQDKDGRTPAFGGGVNAGCRLPLSRDNRWQAEFTLGAGLYRLAYDKFENRPDGLQADTRRRTYVGIDQAGVSVCYRFDVTKKGGKR